MYFDLYIHADLGEEELLGHRVGICSTLAVNASFPQWEWALEKYINKSLSVKINLLKIPKHYFFSYKLMMSHISNMYMYF